MVVTGTAHLDERSTGRGNEPGSNRVAFHSMSITDVSDAVDSDPDRGLTDHDAALRLERFGPNLLPSRKGAGWIRRSAAQFDNPLIYVLLAAGAITAVLGEYVDSGVIFAVVLVNAVIGFVQESKAGAALDSLRSMAHASARAVRDGEPVAMSSESLVRGDLVLLDAGDKVPADLRLIRGVDTRIDESTLTGESEPAQKNPSPVSPTALLADRTNMAYSGTLVTSGTASGITVATGTDTELGGIHRLVGSAQPLATPLTRKLGEFGKILTIAILALAAVTFGIGLLRGQDVAPTFVAAVALAVGAIPEGLPAAVTITLAIGVSRMARRGAVIRQLPAVETLGSTTVICSDKTGTLTENQMTVESVWTADAEFEVTGTGYDPAGAVLDESGVPADVGRHEALRWCLLAGAVCTDASLRRSETGWTVLGDPTEAAMIVAAGKSNVGATEYSSTHVRTDTIPFSSESRYMATMHRDDDTGRSSAVVKGAVERVLSMSGTMMTADGATQPVDTAAVARAAETLASRGLRVLATAAVPDIDPADFDAKGLTGRLVFTGLQAMMDPPRAAATASIAACRAAGISVKMITGDHATTAAVIARHVGLLDGEDNRDGVVLTGGDLSALSDAEYPAAVQRAVVFARASPEQKLRLVETFQASGDVVAMTGDGVNDAPALRRANIGVAMGHGGTEVAKDAADIVLTEDDFSTIEAAVEEGRGVFDNLTKFIAWTLPTNLAEGLVILVAIVFGTALPILPTQILWINMTTAVALGLMLAFEPKEPGIMSRSPRRPDEPLLTRALMVRIVIVSAVLVAGAWGMFAWEQAHGAGLDEARTVALNLFVVAQIAYLFGCRSLTRSAWSIGLFTNRWIIVGVSVQIVGQVVLTYAPFMNTLFGTAPIGIGAWGRIVAIAVAITLVVALDKRIRRHRRGSDAATPPTAQERT